MRGWTRQVSNAIVTKGAEIVSNFSVNSCAPTNSRANTVRKEVITEQQTLQALGEREEIVIERVPLDEGRIADGLQIGTEREIRVPLTDAIHGREAAGTARGSAGR